MSGVVAEYSVLRGYAQLAGARQITRGMPRQDNSSTRGERINVASYPLGLC